MDFDEDIPLTSYSRHQRIIPLKTGTEAKVFSTNYQAKHQQNLSQTIGSSTKQQNIYTNTLKSNGLNTSAQKPSYIPSLDSTAIIKQDTSYYSWINHIYMQKNISILTQSTIIAVLLVLFILPCMLSPLSVLNGEYSFFSWSSIQNTFLAVVALQIILIIRLKSIAATLHTPLNPKDRFYSKMFKNPFSAMLSTIVVPILVLVFIVCVCSMNNISTSSLHTQSFTFHNAKPLVSSTLFSSPTPKVYLPSSTSLLTTILASSTPTFSHLECLALDLLVDDGETLSSIVSTHLYSPYAINTQHYLAFLNSVEPHKQHTAITVNKQGEIVLPSIVNQFTNVPVIPQSAPTHALPFPLNKHIIQNSVPASKVTEAMYVGHLDSVSIVCVVLGLLLSMYSYYSLATASSINKPSHNTLQTMLIEVLVIGSVITAYILVHPFVSVVLFPLLSSQLQTEQIPVCPTDFVAAFIPILASNRHGNTIVSSLYVVYALLSCFVLYSYLQTLIINHVINRRIAFGSFSVKGISDFSSVYNRYMATSDLLYVCKYNTELLYDIYNNNNNNSDNTVAPYYLPSCLPVLKNQYDRLSNAATTALQSGVSVSSFNQAAGYDIYNTVSSSSSASLISTPTALRCLFDLLLDRNINNTTRKIYSYLFKYHIDHMKQCKKQGNNIAQIYGTGAWVSPVTHTKKSNNFKNDANVIEEYLSSNSVLLTSSIELTTQLLIKANQFPLIYNTIIMNSYINETLSSLVQLLVAIEDYCQEYTNSVRVLHDGNNDLTKAETTVISNAVSLTLSPSLMSPSCLPLSMVIDQSVYLIIQTYYTQINTFTFPQDVSQRLASYVKFAK